MKSLLKTLTLFVIGLYLAMYIFVFHIWDTISLSSEETYDVNYILTDCILFHIDLFVTSMGVAWFFG